MNYSIRKMKDDEYGLLGDFLYEAIFIPEGVKEPPRAIINLPELQVYIKDFGKKEDGIPSFAISLYKEYRGCGIGTALMKNMLQELRQRGYEKASLAVQKANYAVKMYQNVGFEIIDENEEEYIMCCLLRGWDVQGVLNEI